MDRTKTPGNVVSEGRVPPYSKEAESAVLGCCLLNQKALVFVRPILKVDSFYVEAHRRIFTAMCELSDRSIQLDHITLGNELIKKGDLEKIGGPMALDKLTENVATVANVEHYAKIVRNKASVRRMIYAAQQIVADGFGDFEDTEEFMTGALAAITKASSEYCDGAYEGETADQGMKKAFERLEKGPDVAAKEMVDTGISGLKLRKGVCAVLGGRPSNGKSLFAHQIAQNVARKDKQVVIFSLEDTRDNVWNRMLTNRTGIPVQRIEQAQVKTKEDWDKLIEAASSLHSLSITVHDRTAVSSQWMKQIATLHKQKHGLDLIIVDYLQLMNDQVRGESRYEKFTKSVQGLVSLARELNVVVLIVSQLRRPKSEEKKVSPPSVEMLKETGELEQAGKIIVLLHWAYQYDKDMKHPDTKQDELRCDIAKNSNGRAGVKFLKCDMPGMWVGNQADADENWDQQGSLSNNW